jgi:hypothetical protein
MTNLLTSQNQNPFPKGSDKELAYYALRNAVEKICQNEYQAEWESYKKRHGKKANRDRFHNLTRPVPPEIVNELIKMMDDLGRNKVSPEQVMATLLHNYDINEARFPK